MKNLNVAIGLMIRKKMRRSLPLLLAVIMMLTVLFPVTALAAEPWEEYYQKGVEYAQYGMHAEAIEQFTKAIELNPDNPELYIQRGYSHALCRGEEDGKLLFDPLENYTSAMADFQKALDLDPQNENIIQKVEEARIFADNTRIAYEDTVKLPVSLLEDPDHAEKVSSLTEPVFDIPVEYAKTEIKYGPDGSLSQYAAYDEHGRKIYADIYNYADSYPNGYDVCHTWYYYDGDRLILRKYCWENNQRQLPNMPLSQAAYEYGADGRLQTLILSGGTADWNYRVIRIDHYTYDEDGKAQITRETFD